MASLIPGVLSKLLDNVNNKSAKVAGEHRSALLQVIGIVPSLVGADDGGDPWKSKGFFLRVSDSVHSAYVALSEDDLDLILSDKIQLGQFIHVTRLDSGPSVPVLRGVRPVPKRRPCVGDPKDLISSDLLPNRSKVCFSKEAKKGVRSGKDGVVKRGEPKGKIKEKRLGSDDLSSRRLSFGNGNGKSEGLELRRLSLDSSRKAWDRSPRAKNGERNVSKLKKASNSPDSAAICSARKDSSEKDLAVKHPSLGVSPLKTKNVIVSPKLIGKPIRKDIKPSIDGAIPSHIRKDTKSSVDGTIPSHIRKDTKSSIDGAIPSHLVKVPLSLKTWSDLKILWDSLPTTVYDVGKEVMSLRNAGFLSAVNALEETSATEGVLRCMSKFAELCESSQKDPTVPLVDPFLNLHHNMQKAAAAVNLLIESRSPEAKTAIDYTSQCSLPVCKNFTNKNATSWVQAAIDTDLSNFNLFRKEDNLTGEKCHYIVLENTPKKTEVENHSPGNKRSPRNHGPTVLNPSAKGLVLNSRPCVSNVKKHIVERKEWSEGSGLKEAASLGENLISVSQAWFLNYLEDSLKNRFGLSGGGSAGGVLEVAALLGQLKRVNQWLDESVEDGSGADERIEGLKKKLYGFLLDQVNSSVVQTG